MNTKGLTSIEVQKKEEKGEINTLSKDVGKSYAEILLKNVFTFFNILLLCFFIILIITKSGISNLLFIGTVLVNTAIGTIQQFRSKWVTDRLSILSESKIKVLRDSTISKIPSNKIVTDDIIILEIGNEIPADCIIESGTAEINESLLTGESIPIKKKEGDTIFAGTFVVSGQIFARVEKVGDKTYAATLQKTAKVLKNNSSELLKSLNSIIKFISIIIIPIILLSFFSKYLLKINIEAAIRQTIGAGVGMVPAGMFLLASVALAVGVLKLSKRNVLCHDMYSIEMLARTDVLCFDKTGTLTDGTMEVEDVKFFIDEERNKYLKIFGSYLSSMRERNQTSLALEQHFKSNKNFLTEDILPFSSERKYSSVKFKNEKTFYLGAPEILLKEKTEKNKKILLDCEKYQNQGFRVLLFAESSFPIESEKENLINLTPLFSIIMTDHIRKEAKEMLKWFYENNVDIKIISGDNILTVANIAKNAGVKNYEKSISLEGLTTEEIKKVALEYSVFGRVTPDQKALIVEALQEKGKTVAITGDGVNDIIAMKKANCSVAMGNGSDAARSVANIVLLENDFSVMKDIVSEGRRVVNNVQRSSVLYLMKTFSTAALTLIGILLSLFKIEGFDYPFEPKDIQLFGWFCIGIPSVFLALQPDNKKIQGSFIKNVISKTLPASIILFFSVFLIMLLQNIKELNITEDNILIMEILAFTYAGGFTVLFRTCKKFDRYRTILFISVLTLSILCNVLLSTPAIANSNAIAVFFKDVSLYDLRKLSIENWLLLIIIALLANSLFRTIKKISNQILSITWDR